jgi:hypothetical protein
MALSGDAKREYQRAYMREKRTMPLVDRLPWLDAELKRRGFPQSTPVRGPLHGYSMQTLSILADRAGVPVTKCETGKRVLQAKGAKGKSGWKPQKQAPKPMSRDELAAWADRILARGRLVHK